MPPSVQPLWTPWPMVPPWNCSAWAPPSYAPALSSSHWRSKGRWLGILLL